MIVVKGLEGKQEIIHNLNTRQVVVMVYDDDYNIIPASIWFDNNNCITVEPGYVPLFRKNKKLIMGKPITIKRKYSVTVCPN